MQKYFSLWQFSEFIIFSNNISFISLFYYVSLLRHQMLTILMCIEIENLSLTPKFFERGRGRGRGQDIFSTEAEVEASQNHARPARPRPRSRSRPHPWSEDQKYLKMPSACMLEKIFCTFSTAKLFFSLHKYALNAVFEYKF